MSGPWPPSPAGGAATGLPLALTGATAATRYVGGTASGAPTTGTFAVGDFVIDQTGKVYVCTAAGTPGTWAAAGGSGGGGYPKIDTGNWEHPGFHGAGSVVTEAYPGTFEAVGDMHGGLMYFANPGVITALALSVGTASAGADTATFGVYSAVPNLAAATAALTRVSTQGPVSIATTGTKSVTGLSIPASGFMWLGFTATATFTPVEFEARPSFFNNLGQGGGLTSSNISRYWCATGALPSTITVNGAFTRPNVKFPVLVKFTPS